MNAQARTADDVLSSDVRPAGGVTPPSRKGAARPVPTVSSAFAHLSLEALREYRRSLGEEEGKVSYWRRILQARLDVVEAGTGARVVDTATLRPLLSSERVGAGRRALIDVLALDDIPPLPSLGELWDRQVSPSDEVATAALRADLRLAEAQLSAYRSALHRRIGEATGELIARYREHPELCLSALPLARRGSTSGA
jgi:hypothetical protein